MHFGSYSFVLMLSLFVGIFGKEDIETHMRYRRAALPTARYYQGYIYRPGSSGAAAYFRMFDNEFSKDHYRSILSNSNTGHHELTLNHPFYFYGHEIMKFSIGTGGYLFMGQTMHKYAGYTEHAAPLQANFNPSLSLDSEILFRDFGGCVYFYWKKLYIDGEVHYGQFSFQLAFCRNGTMIFAYRQIPTDVSLIPPTTPPMHAGLSDAYYKTVRNSTGSYRILTIYHEYLLPLSDVKTGTAIRFVPLSGKDASPLPSILGANVAVLFVLMTIAVL